MRRLGTDSDLGAAIRVLVVEDDAAIADAIRYALEKDGMSTTHAGTLRGARARLDAADAVVLDLGLPDGSGFSLLLDARRLESPPRVLVLTSRDDEVDCVAALEAGADDYVTKPFSPRVIAARIRAVLRRPTSQVKGSEPAGLAIDRARRLATFAKAVLPLTKIEFDLLAVLAEHPGRVLTRKQLVEQVWGGAYALAPRTVDSHFKALRQKLRAAGAPEGLLETVRAVGFRLREGPE